MADLNDVLNAFREIAGEPTADQERAIAGAVHGWGANRVREAVINSPFEPSTGQVHPRVDQKGKYSRSGTHVLQHMKRELNERYPAKKRPGRPSVR